MSTYKIMQDRIADEVQRSNLTAQIKNAILSAIEDLKGDRFARINDGSFTLATVANQQFYNLSALLTEAGAAVATGTTLIEVDGITVNLNGLYQELRPVSVSWVDAYQIPSYVGQPMYYALQLERLALAPTPNAVYTCTIRGHVEFPALSADSDSNAWMTAGEKLVRGTAKAILARDVLQDMELAQMGQMAAGEARAALDRQTAARSTQRLSAWGY